MSRGLPRRRPEPAVVSTSVVSNVGGQADKENQPSSTDVAGDRRPRRSLQPTAKADPRFVQGIRTDVPSRPQVQASMMQASDEVEELEEPSFQDLGRQTGQLVDEYDDDYEERQLASKPRHHPNHALLQAEAAMATPQQPSMPTTQEPPVPSPFVATTTTFPGNATSRRMAAPIGSRVEKLIHPPLSMVTTPSVNDVRSFLFQPPPAAPSVAHPLFTLSPSPTPSLLIASPSVSSAGQHLKRVAEDKDDVAREARRRAKKLAHNRQRTSHGSFSDDPDLQKAMSIAADLVKCYFITENAFPSKGQRTVIRKAKFEEALNIVFGDRYKYAFTSKLEQLLSSEETNVRGRLKTILLVLLPQVYGLRHDAAAVTENAKQVRFLLERTEAIHYRFHRADPAIDEKLFRHSIIERAIHEAYFKHRDSIGVVYSNSFNPIPWPTFALVLTVLHHCLSLWETGTLIKQNITAQCYPEYDGFLGNTALGQMKDGELGTLWTILRRQMFERGMRAVGAAVPEQVVPSPTKPLSSTRLERELLELQAELGLPSTSQTSAYNPPPACLSHSSQAEVMHHDGGGDRGSSTESEY